MDAGLSQAHPGPPSDGPGLASAQSQFLGLSSDEFQRPLTFSSQEVCQAKIHLSVYSTTGRCMFLVCGRTGSRFWYTDHQVGRQIRQNRVCMSVLLHVAGYLFRPFRPIHLKRLSVSQRCHVNQTTRSHHLSVLAYRIAVLLSNGPAKYSREIVNGNLKFTSEARSCRRRRGRRRRSSAQFKYLFFRRIRFHYLSHRNTKSINPRPSKHAPDSNSIKPKTS